MIRSLALTNFKSIGKTLLANDDSIEEGKLDFAPLTVFCGKNSSGKSTVLQSILLLAQTLQNNIPSNTLILNGPMVKLGGIKDIRSNSYKLNDIIIDLSIAFPLINDSNISELKKQKSKCISEEIYLAEHSVFYKYALSNEIYEIIYELLIKTGFAINLHGVKWKINNALSNDVKELMNKHDVNYSLTNHYKNGGIYYTVNKRVNDEWYVFQFYKKNNHIHLFGDTFNNDIDVQDEHFSSYKKDIVLDFKQKINISIAFSNVKSSEISNMLPVLSNIKISSNYNIIDLYIDDDLPEPINFEAVKAKKNKNLLLKEKYFDWFSIKTENKNKKYINNNKLVGLKIDHFFPCAYISIENNYKSYSKLYIDLKFRKFLKSSYSYNNQSVTYFNRNINELCDFINKFNIKKISNSQFFIAANCDIKNKTDFIKKANEIISMLEKNDIYALLYNSYFLYYKEKNSKLDPILDDNYSFEYSIKQQSLEQITQNGINEIKYYLMNNIKYIGPLREEPHLQYEGYIENTQNIGIKGENCAGILYHNNSNIIKYIPPKNFENNINQYIPVRIKLLNAVNDWLQYLKLADGVEASFNGRYGYELKVVKETNQNDLPNVGVGVSQLLPIIITCLLAPEGSTIIIEQPELHLHPSMQSKITDFFIATRLCNKQLIIETHSEYIINRLRQKAINWPIQNPLEDELKIYFTENLGEDKDNEGFKKGNTIFRPILINEYAAMSDWPEGFFDEASKNADEIIKAVSKKWDEEDNY